MVALHEMSAARFQLSYDGPALRSGAMDVNELAPALLATADLFREANKQLNGDRAEVALGGATSKELMKTTGPVADVWVIEDYPGFVT
jgi:hypothetical protein